MEYLVLYTSQTGNTQKIAEAIYQQLPGNSKEIKDVEEYTGNEDAEIIFVGFWIDRGTCPLKVVDALELMEGKKVALFATCGMGKSKEYYDSIKCNAEAWVPDGCEDLGFFICQGKMPEHVLDKYHDMRGKIPEEKYQQMVDNYEEGLSHPDANDIKDVQDFTMKMIKDR